MNKTFKTSQNGSFGGSEVEVFILPKGLLKRSEIDNIMNKKVYNKVRGLMNLCQQYKNALNKNKPLRRKLNAQIKSIVFKVNTMVMYESIITIDFKLYEKLSEKSKKEIKCDYDNINRQIHRIKKYNKQIHMRKATYEKIMNEDNSRNTLARKYGNESYSKTMRLAKRNIGKCQLTGKTNNLVVHHINSVDKHPEMIVDESNLVVITEDVHKAFHKKYGYGNNTQAQWDEFTRNY